MPDWLRREALHAVGTAAAVGLAGCSGNIGDDRDPQLGRRVTDYELLSVRAAPTTLLFTQNDGEGGGLLHVTRRAERESLRFGDAEPARRLKCFVDATNLDEQSVYLHEQELDECRRLKLVAVARGRNELNAEFCEELMPADVQCDPATSVRAAIAIRLPFPGDGIDSLGSGSGPCQQPPAPRTDSDGGDGS